MLTRTAGTECPSDLTFDEWMAEGLPEDLRAEVEAHLAHCVRCAVRLETMTTARERFLERRPTWRALHAGHTGDARDPADRTAPTAARTRPAPRGLPGLPGWPGWVWGGLGGLAAAAVALLVMPSTGPGTGTRSKGGPSLQAFVAVAGHAELLLDGDTVRPGDRLVFRYSTDRPRYFALFQSDGHATVVQHPLGQELAALAPGRDVALGFSVELDGVGGRERFIAVFCDTPRPTEPLRSRIEAAAGRASLVPPPPGCHVARIALAKAVEEDPRR